VSSAKEEGTTMRRVLVVLSLVACAAAVSADLPLKQVVLFSSGVGYFDRQGFVTGDEEIPLTFRTEQINDLLKSLVLQDYDGGRIAPVTYAPQEPLGRTLSSFAVDISDNPSLSQLLDRMRGIPIEVKADRTYTGTVVGVETQQKTSGESILAFQVINLLTAEGLVQVPIWHVKSLRVTDAKVDADLKKALGVLAQSHDVSKRPVTLSFRGQGKRRVGAGYLLETPIWKTSYRLVVLDDRLQLQGWAIVENTTDDDWANVDLTLVSGRPISFIQDLYQPLYLSRPVIAPSVTPAARPRAFEGAVEAYDEAEMALAGPKGDAGAARPERARRAGGAGGMGAGMGMPGGMVATPPAAPPMLGEALNLMMADALPQAMAAGEKAGELFKYAIDQPVTIERQKSAMIPIVNAATEGEQVSVYNAGTDPRHPQNGLKLKNTTGLHLMGGPVTVFDGGIYAGDALIEDVSPEAERLLTYAVDLDVEMDRKEDWAGADVLSVKILRGIVVTTRKQRRETLYTARSISAHDKTLLIEHPYQEDWTLVQPEKPEERTRAVHRFRVPLEATGKAELKVLEEQPIAESVQLSDADADQVALLLQTDKLSEPVKQALLQVAQWKVELAETQAEIAQRDARLKEITDEQKRIRDNMGQLSRDSDLYRRYVTKLDTQETEFEKLQGEIEDLREKEQQQLKQINDYIAELNVE
jgi:hypothetical protein